ncbi:MAG: hypothetical protein OXH04_12655 [Acidobacteria bacterium]|nr:hypothetical protein [Acidobacteriota bacterium]
MRRFVIPRAAVAVVACLVGVGLAGAASAQELGLIYAAVIDQTGQPVTDLAPEEFQVSEDGNAARVVSADVGAEPMKIALLVDNGRRISMGQAINPLRDGVAAFIENIPAEHEIGLFTVGGQIRRRVGFTTDRGELLEEVADIHVDNAGSVRFIDGVRETWDRRYDGDEAWPIFVAVLTDALESSAFMNEDRFMGWVGNLRAGGVTVHSVLWRSRGAGFAGQVATGFAINLAENTGGRYTQIAAATAYEDNLRQLATDMAAHWDQASIRYRVIYERPDPAGQSVSVSVTRPGVNLQLFGDRSMP